MGHKAYVCRLEKMVGLYEVEYPDDYDEERISECNAILHDGTDIFSLPEEVGLKEIYSYAFDGRRFSEWEDEREYQPIGTDMVCTVRDYRYTLAQFRWHLDFLSDEEYFKFVLYLVFNGFSGSVEDMVAQFHAAHYAP